MAQHREYLTLVDLASTHVRLVDSSSGPILILLNEVVYFEILCLLTHCD